MDVEIKEFFEGVEKRKKARRNSEEADYQAILEMMFVMMKDHLLINPGRMLPMQIDNDAEWDCFLEAEATLDLPPDVSAVFISPSALRTIRGLLAEGTGLKIDTGPGDRIYSVIAADPDDPARIMQAYIPGARSVGIDVYDDGKLLAEYNYNDVDACMGELSHVVWTFLNSAGEEWTEARIIRYTENFFTKSQAHPNRRRLPVHSEYSYFHNPGMLNLSPRDALFSVLRATVPDACGSLEEAVKSTNEINHDLDFGDPPVTEAGILNGDPGQCRALLGRIQLEMDMSMDLFEELENFEFSRSDALGAGYKAAFDDAAKEIFETISGVAHPGLIDEDKK
ncbi:MAG: hypothetical protein GY859_40580 [Desulfobacterales bacterium]|nr:hypothetical protein [Desulfobacterales bacterium]